MRHSSAFFFVLGASLVTLISQQALISDAQIFDQLMNGVNTRNNAYNPAGSQDTGSRFSSMFKDMMSVNVPVFYDMVKNGSSMGINVLSGLVRVDRGEEAERSGLQGRRPLSVRVFGVPVYERGVRVRDLNDFPSPFPTQNGKGEPKAEGASDDELPIYNLKEAREKLKLRQL